MLGVGEFDPAPSIMKTVGDTFCVDGAITQILCTSTIFLICGFDSQELNTVSSNLVSAIGRILTKFYNLINEND